MYPNSTICYLLRDSSKTNGILEKVKSNRIYENIPHNYKWIESRGHVVIKRINFKDRSRIK